MDDYRPFGSSAVAEWDFPDSEEPCMDLPPMIGADERRMHVRAYERWVSLLNGHAFPAIADLDASTLGEFGPFSVLLDFSKNSANAEVMFVGRALREEGGLDLVPTIADVPDHSVLSRLTSHFAEVQDNRAPVGFEAEFVNRKGVLTLYRGILMPFSSDGETIDYVHGVISWKLSAGAGLPADIVAAVTTAFAGPAQPIAPTAPDWIDTDFLSLADETPDFDALVAAGRASASDARDLEARTRIALYQAISIAHEIAVAADRAPEAFAAAIDAAGLKQQARAPMTPIVKLVFGAGYDRKRVTEFAAVLTHAKRQCIAPGLVADWLARFPGGIKAVVAAERREQRPALKLDRIDIGRARLRAAPARATIDLGGIEDEFVLLVGRRETDGQVAILSPFPRDSGLIERALRLIAP